MNEQEIIEYNRRQITHMEKSIALFKAHKIHINNFMSDISGCLKYIYNPPITWGGEIDSLLWEIEIIYASALNDKKKISSKDAIRLDNYLQKIENLIIEYKNSLPPEEDWEYRI